MTNNDSEKYFLTTHINVRQSIAFLVIRLVFIELLFALFFYFIAFPNSFLQSFFAIILNGFSIRFFLFLLAVLAKLFFEFTAVYRWLNEYYEITTTKLIHRKGFLFRKWEMYDFKQVRLAGVKQGLFGRLLNYGTIHLYDPYANKNVYVYLVHNPVKYFDIIKDFVSKVSKLDEEREVVSFHKIAES